MTEKITITEKLVELYGIDYIMRQCAEECMEQAHAIMKLMRATYGEATDAEIEPSMDHVIEEIADVTLTTGMVMEVLDIDIEDLNSWILKKLERTKIRIAKAEEMNEAYDADIGMPDDDIIDA